MPKETRRGGGKECSEQNVSAHGEKIRGFGNHANSQREKRRVSEGKGRKVFARVERQRDSPG